jgi:hypothetical protein
MTSHSPPMSLQTRQASLTALYEYMLVTLPVGMYVLMEAVHKHDLLYLARSPEWSIATIFLSFQGASLYQKELKKMGRGISETVSGLFGLAALCVTVTASIVAFLSMHADSAMLLFVRLFLFVLSSLAFILMVGGATLIRLREAGTL